MSAPSARANNCCSASPPSFTVPPSITASSYPGKLSVAITLPELGAGLHCFRLNLATLRRFGPKKAQ
jgi:hypothetical protein